MISNFLKAVFHKLHSVHSWILYPKYTNRSSKYWQLFQYKLFQNYTRCLKTHFVLIHYLIFLIDIGLIKLSWRVFWNFHEISMVQYCLQLLGLKFYWAYSTCRMIHLREERSLKLSYDKKLQNRFWMFYYLCISYIK